LDHLGLVAVMCDELGIGDVIDQATPQHPDMRMVTAGTAVKAMVINGRGCVNQHLDLVPHFVQHKPTARLLASCIEARHLNDDTLGRALDTLYADGVTALSSLLAATAARRLGRRSRFAPLDRPSFHVDGRDKSDEAPEAPVMHITRGDSRDHRPDLNPVRLDLMVEHQAGIPVLMPPLRGHSRETRDVGQVVREPMAPVPTTDGTTSLVADRALYRHDNLQKRSETRLTWSTRVPATVQEAQTAMAQTDPQAMALLIAGSRLHAQPSTDGGGAPRWLLLYSERRRPQAQRTVDKYGLQPRAAEATAFKKLCRTAFACEAEAQPALATFTQALQTTAVQDGTIHPTPRYGQRGRPGPGCQPPRLVSHMAGALASVVARREALVAQQSCCILATNALDTTPLSPQARLEAYNGQPRAARGFRFRNDPHCLASSLDRNTPERIMALLMVMTVC
jgi:transposase